MIEIGKTIIDIVVDLYTTYLGHRLGLSKDKGLRQDELDRSARYLAFRVVGNLDAFVSECCKVVDDRGLPDEEGYMQSQFESPEISFPKDVDWKSIKPDLMYRVLGFQKEIEDSIESIKTVGEFISGPPDYSEYFDERIIRYGQLGLTGLTLADEIRKTYRIPTRPVGDWHPKDMLERALKKTKKEREEYLAGKPI